MTAMVWVLMLALGSTMATLGWALAAGPLRVFERSSGAFAWFNAMGLVAGVVWSPWFPIASVPPQYRLALGLGALWFGVERVCSGVHTLHDLKPNPVASPIHLLTGTFLLVGVAWFDASGLGLWALFFLAAIAAFGFTLHQAYPSLKAQDGVAVARWSLAPLAVAPVLWLGGAVFVTLQCLSEWGGGQTDVRPSEPLVILVASLGLVNCGLVGFLLLKLLDKIRELSTEDELTGAMNHRFFMALLNAERDRLRRTPQCQSLLVCEIDQYHHLNKQLGFAAGDAALRHVTGVLGRGLRKTDRLGRSLDAELLMFLPATPIGGGMLVAERIQASVKAQPFLWNGQAVTLTLSMGVGARDDGDMPSETLVSFCTQAVHRARREGGGRIRAAQYDTLVTDIPVDEPDANFAIPP